MMVLEISRPSEERGKVNYLASDALHLDKQPPLACHEDYVSS